MNKILSLSKEKFNELFNFYATWYGLCKMVNPNIAADQIHPIFNFITFRHGQEISQKNGFTPYPDIKGMVSS